MTHLLKKIFSWIGVAALASLTACTDDTFNIYDNTSDSEYCTVSFTLRPEAAATSSRADDGYVDYPTSSDETRPEHYGVISDGSKVDMLIYAVYDEKGRLLEGYETESEVNGFDSDHGQTIVKVDKFPVTVNINLKRGVKYRIAFWAQSSKTKVYNTSDLRKVEVIYGELDPSTGIPDDDDQTTTPGGSGNDGSVSANQTTTPNNDEFRDVFCRSVEVTPGANGNLQRNVYLYRPLAQINVGTSGFDYEVVTRNATRKYTYSKIRINRVARYLDVVADSTYSSTTGSNPFSEKESDKTAEAFAVVDFGYAPIPAYANNVMAGMNSIEAVPKYPSYTKWEWIYNPDFTSSNTDLMENLYDFQRDYYNHENFLRVKLYENIKDDEPGYTPDNAENDGKGDGFRDYANFNKYNNQNSETFKYLSMCYVLTSSTKDKSVVVNNVKVWLATSPDGADEFELLNINNVPVQRNYRTNIIGNLLTSETTFQVKLDRDFAGEYNGFQSDNQWEFSGPLAKGVFYDAEEDEIQISDADGLIWFQRMVNGNLTIRETHNGTNVGKGYNYYTSSYREGDQPSTFRYKPVKQSDYSDVVVKRILRATHQDCNGDGNWPEDNNFHFCGYEKDADGNYKKDENGNLIQSRAKVKLMADIDLTGIEWIPIGFDGRIMETVFRSFEEDFPSNRGFYGEFDGNNHMITGLSTKRFSARVPDWNSERIVSTSPQGFGTNFKFVDNFQWFARGLFGEIGGSAKIRNVRLFNVDIYGCQCVGGVVGAAYGDDIEITNCIVDGGSIIVTPMFRGDDIETTSGKPKDRTFARGIYLGGIVGYFRTNGGSVENCQVRNVYMRGYRRIGGIVGSINLYHLEGYNTSGNDDDVYDRQNRLLPNGTNDLSPEGAGGAADVLPKSIAYNRIVNSTIIASQMQVFNMRGFVVVNNGYAQTGFGWEGGIYNLYAHPFVGGRQTDLQSSHSSICHDNMQSGLNLATFTNSPETDKNGRLIRIGSMEYAPLKYLPMLSSWFTDSIILTNNYYGEAGAHKYLKLHEWNMRTSEESKNQPQYPYLTYVDGTKAGGRNTFKFPMVLPHLIETNWTTDFHNPNVGLYVESIGLDGKGGIGGRSVITPNNVDGDGACVMYICSRNRHQFYASNNSNKSRTVVKNMVLRGEPPAYAGILIAPNKNLSQVWLENVAIYDVYKTIALDDWENNTDLTADHWPNREKDDKVGSGENKFGCTLHVANCNLRGYTVPGDGWKSVEYTHTTFEEGTFTGHGANERTCRVQSNTEFKNCFFKAPYVIRIASQYTALEKVNGVDTRVKKDDLKVTFDNCYATATSTKNVKINYKTGCTRIVVESNSQGEPIVTYYNGTEVMQ